MVGLKIFFQRGGAKPRGQKWPIFWCAKGVNQNFRDVFFWRFRLNVTVVYASAEDASEKF